MAFRHVLRNELRLLRADRALVLALAFFGALFVYAVTNGISWVRFQERTLASVEEAQQERIQSLRAELLHIERGGEPASAFRDPRAPNVLGGARGAHTTALPPGPLAALAVGQSDLLPYYYDVSIYTNEQSFLQNGEVENPLNLMVGRFDLLFMIVYLLPLLVLALGYNVVSAEREQGTLALTLSQPVSARSVVTAKVVFRALLVLGVVFVLSAAGAMLAGSADPARVFLWSGAAALYALFWFVLAAWVNTLGRSSAWNATLLVGAWIVLVVVLPAAVNIAAGLLHPLPSRVEMITVQRDASNEAVNQRSELLARYLEDHPEMAGAGVPDSESTAALAWAATEEVNRRLAEVAEMYEARIAAQRKLVDRYRFASPALLAQSVLLDAAGTGDARFALFEAQVRDFAEEWKSFFVPALLQGARMDTGSLEGAPSFTFVEEPSGTVFRRAGLPLLMLLLLTGLVAGLAGRGLARVQARGSE